MMATTTPATVDVVGRPPFRWSLRLSILQLWFITNTLLWPFAVEIGGLRLGLNVVLLTIGGLVWFCRRQKISVFSAKAATVFAVYLVISSGLAFLGPCTDQFVKAALTAPILLFLILLGLEVGRTASDQDWIGLEKTAVWALLISFLGFGIEAMLPSLFPLERGFRLQGKYSGLFREPSHVGFSLFPCIAVLLISKTKVSRRAGIAALIGLLVVSRSSTLIAMIVAWLVYRVVVLRKIRQAAVLLLWAGSVLGMSSAINFKSLVLPTLERVAAIGAPDETSNASSVVYVQGWQDAWTNLVRTHGRGLGPNMMGCNPLPAVPARAVLQLIASSDTLNAQDGSFLFSKIVSEAGAIGVLVYIVVVFLWARLEGRIRIERNRQHQLALAVRSAVIFCFVASSFIRGVGYFSGGLLLWVAAASDSSRVKLLRPMHSDPAAY